MLKSAANKVMWVGRATVFLVGLAVILALIFGATSTALAANGDPFLLGKKNVASAVSTLVKQGPGPALNLVVESGQPPLKVNSAKKVANLNADKLDGKDSTKFYAAGSKVADSDRLDGKSEEDFYTAGSKVADSDKVDGKDSSEFAAATHAHAGEDITSGTVEADRIEDGPGSNLNADQLDGVDSARFWRGGTYTLYKNVSGTANSRTNATHTCNSGGKLLSGGYHMFGSGFEVYADFPYDNTYYLDWQSGATAANATLYVHCADF